MNKLLEPYGTIHLVRTHTGRREKKQEHTPCIQEGGTTSKYVQEKNTILHVLCTKRKLLLFQLSRTLWMKGMLY